MLTGTFLEKGEGAFKGIFFIEILEIQRYNFAHLPFKTCGHIISENQPILKGGIGPFDMEWPTLIFAFWLSKCKNKGVKKAEPQHHLLGPDRRLIGLSNTICSVQIRSERTESHAPEIPLFCILTDYSATYIPAPSLSQYNFICNGTRHCCRIISHRNELGLIRAQAGTTSNVTTTFCQNRICESPLYVAPSTAHQNVVIFQNYSIHR